MFKRQLPLQLNISGLRKRFTLGDTTPSFSVSAKTCLLFLFSVFLLWSCANPFAPGKADGNENGGSIITDQKTPEELLLNFRFAYTFKDSLVYSEILDSSFIFVSTNFNVTPPEAIVWGRDQELRTVGGMFRFFNTLDLTFGSPSSIRILDSLATGEPSRREEKITFTLTLDGGNAIPTLLGEVLFEYVLREDGRWYLIRWEDLQT